MTAVLSIQPWQLNSSQAPAQRLRLAQFWLSAPEDQLEMLWRSRIGETTRSIILKLKPSGQFSAEEIELRDRLNEFLSQGLDQPATTQVMIATFLFSPPGLFTIQGPERYLPAWLISDYNTLYDNSDQDEPELLSSPRHGNQAIQDLNHNEAPDFGVFPSTLEELNGNRLQLNRMLGLANLYYIDPEDNEIKAELEKLRQQFSKCILNCQEAQLESLWQGDLGDRYWAMVRSGIQKEALNSQDQALKDQISQKLTPSMGGGFGQPGSTNAMLVAMLYFEPGSMRVDGAEHKLPNWLLSGYTEIFAQSLEATS